MSLRRLEQCLRAFGPLPPQWEEELRADGSLEFYFPAKRVLPPLLHSEPGHIYHDAKRHAGAVHVPCFRPHACGNPWPVGDLSRERVVALCDDLMVYGGRAVEWHAGVHPAYAPPDADTRREAELQRVAMLVAAGASVTLRCAASCESRRRAMPSSPCHVPGVAAAIQSRVQAIIQARIGASAPVEADLVCASRPHVRRASPPHAVSLSRLMPSSDQRLGLAPPFACLRSHDCLCCLTSWFIASACTPWPIAW